MLSPQLRIEYGNFLARHDWAFFGTLTFARDVTPLEAWAAFRGWARKLAMANATHIRVAVVMEHTKGGRPHFHLLLQGDLLPLTFKRDEARRSWRSTLKGRTGNTRFARFRPGPKAYWYMTKAGEPEMLVACPRPPRCRRAKGGCAEAPGCW